MITLIFVLIVAVIAVWLVFAWTVWRVRRVNRLLHRPERLPQHRRAKDAPAPWLTFIAQAEVEWQANHYGRHAAGSRRVHAEG